MRDTQKDASKGSDSDQPSKGRSSGRRSVKVKEASLSSALLVEAAEIETRLRQHVLELLEPTIRKQTLFEGKLKQASFALEEHQSQLVGLAKLQEGAAAAYEQIEKFKVELSEAQKQRSTHEQVVGDRLSMQEIEITALRQSMEKKVADEATVGRTLKHLGDILNTTKEEMTELRRFLGERLDTNRDKIAKLRDEFETRIMAVENETHRLVDNQVVGDTVISHMKGELSRMSESVGEAIKGIGDLENTKATVTCVEEQQQEFSEFARQVSAHVSGLRQQFGSLVDDVKAHFQTATKVVATSMSEQIDQMRESYKADVTRMDTTLRDMEQFMATQKGTQTAFRTDVEKATNAAVAQIQALRETFEETDAKRKRQYNSLELESQQMKRGVRELEQKMEGQDQSKNVRNELVAMLVESQLLSAALDWQDDQDRKNIALCGYKNSEQKPGTKLPEIDGAKGSKTPRRASAVADNTGREQVLSLDKRCLSCSGGTGTVLAGFKLACLQYAPSPVEYQKAQYSRDELIRLQMDLLNQAKEQLSSFS